MKARLAYFPFRVKRGPIYEVYNEIWLDTSVQFREHFSRTPAGSPRLGTVALEVRFSTCLVTAYRTKSQFHTERRREEVRKIFLIEIAH